jgi:hypothetical protein
MVLFVCVYKEARSPITLGYRLLPPLASTSLTGGYRWLLLLANRERKTYIFLYCTLSRPFPGLDQPHRNPKFEMEGYIFSLVTMVWGSVGKRVVIKEA